MSIINIHYLKLIVITFKAIIIKGRYYTNMLKRGRGAYRKLNHDILGIIINIRTSISKNNKNRY